MDWGEGGRERGTRSRKTKRKETKQHTVYYIIIIMMQTERHAEDLGKTADNATAPASGSTESKAIGRRLRRRKEGDSSIDQREKERDSQMLVG